MHCKNMHFNSFHFNRMDDIPDFLKRLQNKITYYVYKTVNDDDANEYAQKKQDTLKEVSEVKEEYDSAPSTTVFKQSTVSGIDIDRILTELYDYFLLFCRYVLYPLLCIYLSSLVANDLIVYPVGVRIVFFVLILFLCASFVHVTVGMSLFYTARKLYEKYLNRERDDKPKPPIKLMPKIFAMLPITTTISESSFYNFFMYPFRYFKDQNAEKENVFLQKLMKKYTDSLNESFPYYEQIKGDSMFVSRKKELDKVISEMHVIVKPKKVEEKEAPLPPTIQELENKKQEPVNQTPANKELENKKQEPVNQKPANKELENKKQEPVNQTPANKELENKKQEPVNKAPLQSLPLTIQELENKKQEPVNNPVNEKEPKNKPLTEPVPPKI